LKWAVHDAVVKCNGKIIGTADVIIDIDIKTKKQREIKEKVQFT